MAESIIEQFTNDMKRGITEKELSSCMRCLDVVNSNILGLLSKEQ